MYLILFLQQENVLEWYTRINTLVSQWAFEPPPTSLTFNSWNKQIFGPTSGLSSFKQSFSNLRWLSQK